MLTEKQLAAWEAYKAANPDLAILDPLTWQREEELRQADGNPGATPAETVNNMHLTCTS